MVRLEILRLMRTTPSRQQFQFQYGAIGRYCEYKYIPSSVQFQFQYGAIGSCKFADDTKTDVLFQFQYGAIGSASVIKAPDFNSCFNSSMVRLGVFLCSVSTCLG